MGRIVGGFATSHVLFSPDGVEAKAERVVAGLMAIRARIAALEPDVLIVASSDHVNNFTLRQQVTLAVGVADEYTPLGDMGVPKTPFAGYRAFGEAFARSAAVQGFDLVQAEEIKPDHGMMLTKLVADPDGAWPVVPVYINCNMPVPPTPARTYALGRALKAMVEAERPAAERVVVIAGGGLSHWLRTPGQGRVAEAYDRRFMGEMIEGRADELARVSIEELLEETGNGGLELTAWLFMAGAMPPGARGRVHYYEPIAEWGSGMGGLELFGQGGDQ